MAKLFPDSTQKISKQHVKKEEPIKKKVLIEKKNIKQAFILKTILEKYEN